jgi:hypothetical protein
MISAKNIKSIIPDVDSMAPHVSVCPLVGVDENGGTLHLRLLAA